MSARRKRRDDSATRAFARVASRIEDALSFDRERARIAGVVLWSMLDSQPDVTLTRVRLTAWSRDVLVPAGWLVRALDDLGELELVGRLRIGNRLVAAWLTAEMREGDAV